MANEKWYITQAKKYFKKKYGKDMTPSYLIDGPAKQISDYTNVRAKFKKQQEEKVELGKKRYGGLGKGFVSRSEKKSRGKRVKQIASTFKNSRYTK